MKRRLHAIISALSDELRSLAMAGLFALVSGLFLLSAAQAANTPPTMTVPGTSNVTATGAFTYSIPIAVPPGTAGMQPALSLDYSSQNTNGFEGWGWSLGGLASIARCPRTQPIDSIHGSVNYDMNDRFCLNGQRLMLSSGTYGADGSTYSTYIDGFSKIVAHGSAGNGPAWFEVHLKSGTVWQLGNTSDSAIAAVGKTTIRLWLVNKITDTKGNYLTVSYTNDQTNGQAYPNRIDYTGNAGAGVGTYNSVQFAYTTRADIVPDYQAGSLQQMTVLLTDIKTYTGTSEVLDYKLAYRAGASTTHTRLTSFTQCDASSNCLAPTTIGWQGGSASLAPSGTANGLAQGHNLVSGDFNGDGLTDAFQYFSCPTGGAVSLANGSGGFTPGNLTAVFQYRPNHSSGPLTYSGSLCFLSAIYSTLPAPVDFNADGYTDLFLNQERFNAVNDPISVVDPTLNDGHGNQAETASGALTAVQFILGDFNGDGRTDGTDTIDTYLSTGTGAFTTDTTHAVGSGVLAADFDGDGCTDVLRQGTPNAITYFCNPAVSSATVPSFTGYTLYSGDFNGDGLADVLAVGTSSTILYLGTGTGLSSGYTVSGSSAWSSYVLVLGDWNGDGKTDVALLSETSGNPHLIFLSTGTNFSQAATIANSDTLVTGSVAGWNNDGADELWLKKASGDTLYNFGFAPELVTSISNGVGASVSAAYDTLSKNGAFYSKGTGAAYPQADLDGPYYVVKSLSTSNGIGGTYTTNYAYAGAKIDVTAPPVAVPKWNLLYPGLLSFSSMTATDAQTGLVTKTIFHTDLPLTGIVASQTVTSGAVTLRSLTDTYAISGGGTGSNIVTLTQTVLVQNDLDGTALPTVTTAYTYDAYNNPLTVTQTITGGGTQTTTNTFTNDTTDWILGQLTSTSIHSIVGSSNLTRAFSFAHDPASGLLTQQVVEPSNSPLRLQTDIGYDAFGNRHTLTQSGSSITTRSDTVTYASNGALPANAADALSHTSWFGFSAAFGAPTSQTDPNGLVTSASYDSLGRPILVIRPDGNKSAISYAYCSGVNGGSASCPSLGAYLQTVTPENSGGSQNGASAATYYDSLGRVIATDLQGFNGSLSRTATQYDANLRVSQTSRPYFVSGGTAKWTSYAYDTLGRVTQTTFPDSSHSTYGYDALSSSVTNAKSQTTTTVLNALGLVASVTDANSKTTSYTYDAFGDLLTVTDPLGNVATNTFDIRGRKTASHDPDMGNWSYGYDVLSELTSQTDAKSQTTTLTYDLLSRLTERSEPSLDSRWTYDSASHGIGGLASACTGSGCTTPGNANYFRAQTYDNFGRPSGTTLTVGGAGYSYTTTYDSDGRIDTVTYPSSFVAKYVYNASGYLSQIKDNASGTAYWTANARDAELHLTQSTAGNGIVTAQSFDGNTGRISTIQAGPSSAVANFSYLWDSIGNLETRTDSVEGYSESFCYDALNRATNYALGASCTGSGTKTVGYDAIGNIASKTAVGTYSYPASGPSSVRPHAVSSIAGTVNGVTNPSYAYDANGTMTSGGNRTIAPTSFNMAASVVQGTVADCFTYDSEHNRIEMEARASSCTGSVNASTIYLNDPVSGSMEEKVTAGGAASFRDIILADGQIVAVRSSSPSTIPPVWGGPTWASFTWTASSNTTSVVYVTSDHLGSVSVLTDASAAVSERNSYDAWGLRRNPNGSDAASCTAITSQLTRGFTDQEHLDPVCAINFNARLYDPTIAKFLAADSIVPNPMNGQSFNRYAYVIDNPLNATDPSGHIDTVVVYGPLVACQNGCGAVMVDSPNAGFGSGADRAGGSTPSKTPPKPNKSQTPCVLGPDGVLHDLNTGNECVVVTGQRPPQAEFHAATFMFGPAGLSARDTNGAHQCSRLVTGAGNLLRASGQLLNVGSTSVLAVGVGIGVLGAPESGGTSLGVTVGFGVVAYGGYSIASDLDALGAFVQSRGTGNNSYSNEVASQNAEEADIANSTGPYAPAVSAAITIKDGIQATFSDGPPMASCP